jgi:hypothetical protein
MSEPRPAPAAAAAAPNLRVIPGGARKGRHADHLRPGERPAARFWDAGGEAPAPATALPQTPAPAPAPMAPAPAALPMAEVLAFMAAQTNRMQEMLAEQRRLRERLDALERAQAARNPPQQG